MAKRKSSSSLWRNGKKLGFWYEKFIKQLLIHALNLEVKLLSLCWVLWRILRAKMENLAGFAVSFVMKKEAWREKEQKRELLNS